MNPELLKALIALLPSSLLLAGAVAFFWRRRAAYALLQVLGAGFLVVVALTHICEALQLFPAMQWGLERSAGHYLDLGAAVLGLALFCVGYFLQALETK